MSSAILVDDQFSNQDPLFVDTLRKLTNAKDTASLAERWKKDARPWARAQLFRYLDMPLDSKGHQLLVKRIFKHAEEVRDDELMARFLLAFDRLVRRRKRLTAVYDRELRTYLTTEVLRVPANTMPGQSPKGPAHPSPSWYIAGSWRRDARLFAYHTRYHLRRRAWRYFRRMGFQKPAAYVPAIAQALALYRDADLAAGENILDSWGLVNALFRGCPALRFTATHVHLADGRGLSELTPGPRHAKLWKDAGAAPHLMALVATAGARLVRVFAMRTLRDHHQERLAGLDPGELLRLLDHDDPEVQKFGAELLAGARDLDKLPVENWLRLLAARNLDALEALTTLVRKHVRLDRFSVDQAVGLAGATATPVAKLGLEILQARTLSDADRRALGGLAVGRCEALAAQIATWALEQVTPEPRYDREVATAFLDSNQRASRRAAWAWLASGAAAAAYADSELWARLVESPHDEVRLGLVDLLAKRAARPSVRGDLAPVWTGCLLAVHRGGRQKARAVHQLRVALAADPARADVLLPVLAVAIRSVRATERRAGLAAVVALADQRPELVPVLRRVLPELDLGDGKAP